MLVCDMQNQDGVATPRQVFAYSEGIGTSVARQHLAMCLCQLHEMRQVFDIHMIPLVEPLTRYRGVANLECAQRNILQESKPNRSTQRSMECAGLREQLLGL